MGKNTTNGPIWINAGEASGDMHGALLATALKKADPSLRIIGMGGPAMEKAGCEISYPMQLISLVGFTEVFAGLPKIIRLLGQLKRDFKLQRPRAIVLIDCPDFNFRVAKIASGMGIPVYYYISPQIWAWRSGRANFLRKHVRKVMCILPFEKDFYKKYGMDVDYVGNPLVDQIPLAELDTIPVEPNRIGILPGSRKKEIANLLPEFAQAALALKREKPDLKFTMVQAPGVEMERLREALPAGLDVDFATPDERYHAIRSCQLVMAASGTVALECALIGTPAIIAYQLSRISFALGRLIINVEHISLPNLIMRKRVFPEHLQEEATAGPIAAQIRTWLDDPAALPGLRAELAQLRSMVGEPRAPDRAAQIILDDLRTL